MCLGTTAFLRLPVTRMVCFLVLLALASAQLWVAFFEQGVYTAPSQQSILYRQQRDPAILVAFAQAQQVRGELTRAGELYRRALVSNPYYLPAWYGLAGLMSDRSQTLQAKALLHRLDEQTRETGWWRWDKAMAAYRIGDTEILARDLAYLVEYVPPRRRQALDLAFSFWPEPAALLEHLGRQNSLYIFNHALRKKNLEMATFIWPLVKDDADLRDSGRLWFVEQLRMNDSYALAASIWKEYFDDSSILHNGDFSSPLLKSGFGWRVWRNSKLQGVHWRIDETGGPNGGPAFHVGFAGTGNIDFHHLVQVVLVRPGRRYLLTGQVRTRNLTTDHRPFFEVVGSRCRAPAQRTDMFAETQSWTGFSLLFEVPETCQAVLVRLRRTRSRSLDNRIDGDLWLAGLHIAEQPAAMDPSAIQSGPQKQP